MHLFKWNCPIRSRRAVAAAVTSVTDPPGFYSSFGQSNIMVMYRTDFSMWNDEQYKNVEKGIAGFFFLPVRTAGQTRCKAMEKRSFGGIIISPPRASCPPRHAISTLMHYGQQAHYVKFCSKLDKLLYWRPYGALLLPFQCKFSELCWSSRSITEPFLEISCNKSQNGKFWRHYY